MTIVLPPPPVTASQAEGVAIIAAMRELADRLREGDAYELRILANRLQVQVARDIAALEYSDEAIDRGLAFYRAHRANPVLTPKGLMDGILTAARGRDG